MKRYQSITTLATLFGLLACSSSPTDTQQVKNESQSGQAQTELAPTFVMRGEVVVGHEVRSFKPCGSNQQFWLSMYPEDQKLATALTRAPYQPLYGEVIGHLETPSRGGFDADFAARFVVDSVNHLSAENPNRCNQPQRPTRAFGNEPFWSMQFNNQGLVYQPMGGQAEQFNIQKSNISSDKRVYTFEQGSLTLTKAQCNDSMSDSVFGWTSMLRLNDRELKGCATLSNMDATADWSGTYEAASTESAGFTISLTLNSDHSAITQYDYSNDDPSIVEKGYWQQTKDDEVSVVMTRHQSQYLVSERRFTRQGNQITAKEEIVSGKRYPIANGGLNLFKSGQ
ncbi:COG3650 family protein [Vibrio maerlii]|uniref:COG3650 family protein n=1 Tax=Vibrio maerlii TaxID=2231648 RepID=UPI000E3B95FA|nr:hypothetical protein [Vibrio maerlii]